MIYKIFLIFCGFCVLSCNIRTTPVTPYFDLNSSQKVGSANSSIMTLPIDDKIAAMAAQKLAELAQFEFKQAKNLSDLRQFYQILFAANNEHSRVADLGFIQLMENKGGEHYFIYCQRLPIGTGTLSKEGGVGFIYDIATLEAYRGRGAATAMMYFFIEKAYREGVAQLLLQSSPMSERLYKKIGFEG